MKKTHLLILILCIPFLNAFSKPTDEQYVFNLQQCIDYALKNNKTLQNSRIDAEIAERRVKETTAYLFPQVNGSSQLTNFLELPTQLLPGEFQGMPGTLIPVQFGTKYNFNYGVEASQLIFDGSYLLGLKASSAYKELAKKNSNRTEIETIITVKKAYYNVLVNRERLKLLEANVLRLKKTLDDTKALYENGLVEKVDYDRLQVVYNNLEVEVEKVGRLMVLGEYLLKFQIGMPVQSELQIPQQLSEIQFEAQLMNDEPADFKTRPEYSMGKAQMTFAKADYTRNKATYLPTIVAFGSYSRVSQTNSYDELVAGNTQQYPTSLVGLKLTVPIFGGFQKYQRVSIARLSYEKSKNDLLTLENALSMEAAAAKIAYQNSLASLQSQRKNMDLAKEVVRVSKIKYDQGVGSSLEVITAETSLKEAETNYLNSVYDALLAGTDLDKAYGRVK